MTFERAYHWIWDFWFADDGDRFHLFYLHAPKTLGDPQLRHRNARIGHASSSDLRTWTDHGVVFPPGGVGDFDETTTWTGSVVRGADGLWRMFYTGTRFLEADAHPNIESVGVATSPDLHTWTKVPGPVVRADPRWYERIGDSDWPEEAWRDPWVFEQPGGGGWHMLITARGTTGSDQLDRGIIGHAVSADLETWEASAPLSLAGGGFAHLEVLQLLDTDDGRLLLFSCDTGALAGARTAEGQRGGVWTLNADGLLGDTVLGDTQTLDASAAQLLVDDRLYSARAIVDRDGRWVVLAFRNTDADGRFLGGITDPVPLDELLDSTADQNASRFGVPA